MYVFLIISFCLLYFLTYGYEPKFYLNNRASAKNDLLLFESKNYIITRII
jgi:hypothetical protein